MMMAMMAGILPDLGKYAGAVLWSYGASLALLAILLIVVLRRGARARAEMEAAEKRDATGG